MEYFIFVKQAGDDSSQEIISLSESTRDGVIVPVNFAQLENAIHEVYGKNEAILTIINDGVLITNDASLKVLSFSSLCLG
jgi:hypothetical protein